MANGIKKLRRARGLSEADLAERLGIPPTEVAKLERWRQTLPVPIVKDLAILFNCGVGEVLGAPIPVTQWQASPYAAGGHSAEDLEPYGNFGFNIGGAEFSFPVNHKAREGVLNQLHDLMPQSVDEERNPWIACGTLNNRLLFVNPRELRRVWFRSDADEETDYFAHPEVYREMDNVESGGPDYAIGPLLSKAINEHIGAISEDEAVMESDRIRLFDTGGKLIDNDLYASDDWVITSIFALECNTFDVPQHSLLVVNSIGYHVTEFVNLAHLGMIQVPLERYQRLSAPEEPASNENEAARG